MISAKDRAILRELAKKQMEYANTPENRRRNEAWYKHNDLQGERPLVTIEEWTFSHEVARPLSCETEKGRVFEGQLMSHIIGREDIDDDRATPDYFAVSQGGCFEAFGQPIEVQNAEDSIGYQFMHPVKDLKQDWEKIGCSNWGFDKNEEDYTLAQEVFAGVMPVKQISDYPGASLTQLLVKLMGMETLFISMYDCPELLSRLLGRLTDEIASYHIEMEQAGILITNNQNQDVAQGTYGHTHSLTYKENASLKDMWGYFDSQETVGVSPDMFAEIFFPHYKRLMDMCGLVNYACCEPVHSIWDSCLSKCDNIRKISISPWCDEEFMGDNLRGTSIIYHRKPSPNIVGAPGFLDEAAYSEHIVETLNAAKGCKVEFSLRDIYTLGGDKGRAKRVVRLIWELIDKHWR